MQSYSDIHRAVLRMFVREAAIKETVLMETINALIENSPDDDTVAPLESTAHLDHFMSLITKKLDQYFFHLKLVKRRAVELDLLTYWVLVNRMDDQVSRLGTGLRGSELTAFREILRLLVRTRHARLVPSEINLSGTPAEGADIQALIQKLMKDKWLVWDLSSPGKITAGIRALAELDEELRNLGAHECEVTGSAVLLTKSYKQWYANITGKEFPTPGDSNGLSDSNNIED